MVRSIDASLMDARSSLSKHPLLAYPALLHKVKEAGGESQNGGTTHKSADNCAATTMGKAPPSG
eukprot:813048-Amphidinium_carterae.1